MTLSLRCSIDPAAQDAVLTELLVLGPSLGTTTALWDTTLAALRSTERGRQLRILRWDLPGHGASPAATEPFTIADLAEPPSPSSTRSAAAGSTWPASPSAGRSRSNSRCDRTAS